VVSGSKLSAFKVGSASHAVVIVAPNPTFPPDPRIGGKGSTMRYILPIVLPLIALAIPFLFLPILVGGIAWLVCAYSDPSVALHGGARK
jgi:hypothetical protein